MCWLKKELEHGDCPFILPEEAHFLKDRERRIREKCVECKKFHDDILSIPPEQNDREVFQLLKVAFEELARRNREYSHLHRLLTIHTRRFQIYHEVLASLQSARRLREVAYILLVAITCREGAAFNRAFLLLYDQERGVFRGFFAIGPADRHEAFEIWNNPETQALDALITRFSDALFEREQQKFAELLEALVVPYDDMLRSVLTSNRAIRVKSPSRGALRKISDAISSEEYALSPLISRDKPVGLIVADNFVTGQPIEDESLEFLEVMAYQGSIAIERAMYYEELQRNIEELHRLNRKLREYHDAVMKMEKMAAVGEVLHQIAHDFKNPLTVIGGLAKALLDSVDKNHPFYKQLFAIKEETDRLMKMLNSMLKGLRERFSLERDWWNVNDLIRKKTDELPAILPDKIELEVELDPDLPDVFIDLTQFENCLDNIITNAIEAMPDGGKLTIKTRWNPPDVEIIVSDTGRGISEEHKERIFDAFFTTKEGGIGLGLYSCHKIVSAHGGVIEVFSEKGKGTTFVIKLKGGDVNERRREETQNIVR